MREPGTVLEESHERDKHAHTLEALAGRRFHRALEVGCSRGVLTELLAWRCRDLLAVDSSEEAVLAAGERLRLRPWVRVERRALPEEMPAGPFDLIVCSEVLYRWTEAQVTEGLDAFTAALRPGALLLGVHLTEGTGPHPLHGRRVHDLLRWHPSLTPVHGEDRPHYRLDLLERSFE